VYVSHILGPFPEKQKFTNIGRMYNGKPERKYVLGFSATYKRLGKNFCSEGDKCSVSLCLVRHIH